MVRAVWRLVNVSRVQECQDIGGQRGWMLSRYKHSKNVFFEILVQFVNENGPVWGDECCVKISGVLEDGRFYDEDQTGL